MVARWGEIHGGVRLAGTPASMWPARECPDLHALKWKCEAWLLQALPEIGQSRAQAIINYRTQKGPFLRIDDLLKVESIGRTVYDKIKNLITVED